MNKTSLWHALTPQECLTRLHSDQARGLTANDAADRLALHGPNILNSPARASFLRRFVSQFHSFLVYILLAAAVVSGLIGEAADAAMIFAIVILNALLGVLQEARAEKALDALRRMTAATVRVVRDGEIQIIPSRELVAGDLLAIETGDRLAADGRLTEAHNLRVDEASLTGESLPADKNAAPVAADAPLAERTCMVYSGTLVAYGRGLVLVTATGAETELGRIAGSLTEPKEEQTPLQRKLAAFGRLLAVVCLAVCFLVFALGIYQGYSDGSLASGEMRILLLTAVSLAVAAIPEGLPSVVTIVLALGMQRMAARNAIVKKLHAVETLGSTTVICSDKTGTLTQNQMTVVRLATADAAFTVSGTGYHPQGEVAPLDSKEDGPLPMVLLTAAALCNDASVRFDAVEQTWLPIGDPTEVALVVAARKAGVAAEEIRRSHPRKGEIPFDSDRKLMTTFHPAPDGVVAYIKGAPDILLERCTHILTDAGPVPLTTARANSIRGQNSAYAAEALRVLAFARREYPGGMPEAFGAGEVERNLTFLGLAGMIDPPRPEAREAVAVCLQAGIRPIMITGDHRDTALAIAADLGITAAGGQALTGAEIGALSPAQLTETVRTVSVFARVAPEHKVAIVDALRANGEITAMTGDGINDAPALRRADIGVAMGVTGTDVAKETADIVLTDDNFASVVAAVEEGRVIYANIRKFVLFLVSCNLAEIAVVFTAMAFGWGIPLLPVQLLWLNLVSDAFPALALGMEKGEPGIMRSPPRDPGEPLLNRRMRLIILVQCAAITAATLGAYRYAWSAYSGDWEIARTFAYSTLITSELLRAYSARSDSRFVLRAGFFGNRHLNTGVAASFLLLLASLYTPMREFFHTYPPVPADWAVIASFAVIPFAAGEALKLLGIRTGGTRPGAGK